MAKTYPKKISMTDCFIYGGRDAAIPLVLVNASNYNRVLKKYSKSQIRWLEQNGFNGKSGSLCSLPGKDGNIERFLAGVGQIEDPFAVADLPRKLPPGIYQLEGTGVRANLESLSCLLYTSPSPRDKRQSRMPSSA